MPGLKKHFPDIRFSGNAVTPDEIDWRTQYSVVYPSAGTATVGTIAAGTVTGAFGLANAVPDYPRNLLFTVSGPTAAGGTAVVSGYNQFGQAISETFAVAPAAGGGSVAGTKIFGSVTGGTYNHGGGDNNSTVTLGYAIGTAANLVAWFGLPVKIKASTDVKRLTFIKNGAVTAITSGTYASSLFDTTNMAFHGTQIVAATDQYFLSIKPTYNSENDAPTN